MQFSGHDNIPPVMPPTTAPGEGHINSRLFKLSRELRDMIYQYTFSGGLVVIDLTNHTTFDNALNLDALRLTCKVIRQECNKILPDRHAVPWCGNKLEVRIPLWPSITWQEYSKSVFDFLLSQSTDEDFSAKLKEEFSSRPENMLYSLRGRLMRRCSIQSLAKEPWLAIDINLGMIDTQTFVHMHHGFWEGMRSAIVHFFLHRLPEARLIAQARLRNGQMVHLNLVVKNHLIPGDNGNEVLQDMPWPAAADGSPVKPTKDTILKAAQGLNMGTSHRIEEVGIDPRYGRLASGNPQS